MGHLASFPTVNTRFRGAREDAYTNLKINSTTARNCYVLVKVNSPVTVMQTEEMKCNHPKEIKLKTPIKEAAAQHKADHRHCLF